MYYDPDLHLFITDDGVFAIRHLKPMVQTWRKDELGSVLAPGGSCRLRFTLYQGSLFSYQWSKAA